MDAIKTFPKFSIFFLVIMLLEIAGLTVIPSFHMVSKAFIMASLIGFYIVTARYQSNVFLTGLIFALLGDCFLLFTTDDFFIIGLCCFLVMQLCYTAAFNKKRKVPRNKDYIISAIIALFGISVLVFLWNKLDGNPLPVTLYIIAICTMAIYAYLRHPKLRGYKMVLFGVVLFILSDTLIALNKFQGKIQYGNIIIMVTYMIAQYAIVTGEVLSDMPRKSIKANKSVKPDSALSRHK